MSSASRHLAILSEFAQAEKPLTILELNELVIPKLLCVLGDISKNTICSDQVLKRLVEFKKDIESIGDVFCKFKVLEDHAAKRIKELLWRILDVRFPVAAFTDETCYKKLEKVLTKLQLCLRSADGGHSPGMMHHKLGSEPGSSLDKGPSLNPYFENHSAFRRITQSYEMLESLHKTCLLCFSAFPDTEINRRTIIYWWIGEELITPPPGDDGEETGQKILENLIEHGFVEDVISKGRVTSCCRVRPFVRSVLMYLANAASFFDYLEDKKYGSGVLSYGNKRRVCLVKAPKDCSASSLQQLRGERDTDLESIEALFNVSKCYLDIKLRWFWKMKCIKALYLGRCESKAIQHIEVKSTKFLAGLSQMKGLRFLSLQGVSKIVKLPDSIGKARGLRILDLRDCNDMEELPEAVNSLERLTHLDLSGCYSLTRLPKGIGSLSELRVMKGFLIREIYQHSRDSCSFHDLRRLKKLKKLSITTSVQSFPREDDLKVFGEMEELRKLTIAWRGPCIENTAKQLERYHFNTKALPEGLVKLDLRHIPYRKAPLWLACDKLQNLRKLYFKGGKFLENLCEKPRSRPIWPVETLRLQSLPHLETTWEQLKDLFPCLTYLEQAKCSKITEVPCNDEGVWMP